MICYYNYYDIMTLQESTRLLVLRVCRRMIPIHTAVVSEVPPREFLAPGIPPRSPLYAFTNKTSFFRSMPFKKPRIICCVIRTVHHAITIIYITFNSDNRFNLIDSIQGK